MNPVDSVRPVPRTCVVLPTFNNCRTVGSVIEKVRHHVPDVIVVNDGSTDETQALLDRFAQEGVHVVTHPSNCGKGAALQTGFTLAIRLGFTHAITMDTDGQHAPDDLPAFLKEVTEHPDALIAGRRDLVGAGRPRKSRVLRAHSNFWVWAETGTWVGDTQSGFRAYPLQAMADIRFKTRNYDFEIESLVTLMWRGTLVRLIPVQAKYGPGTESHFRPLQDFALVTRLNASLLSQRLLMPTPLLALIHGQAYADLPLRKRLGARSRNWVLMSGVSPGILAFSVGMGVLLGILPIWGFQTLAALMMAHLFQLNKPVAIGASNVSFPAAIPLILYGSLLTGRFLLTGTFDSSISVSTVDSSLAWRYAREYLLGAVVLGVAAGIVAATVTYGVARLSRVLYKRRRP